MKVLFPEGLDLQNLPLSRTDKNADDVQRRWTHDDTLYVLSELEKKVGEDDSEVTTSLDYRIATLETNVNSKTRVITETILSQGSVTIVISPAMTTLSYICIATLVDTTTTPPSPITVIPVEYALNSITVWCQDAGDLRILLVEP